MSRLDLIPQQTPRVMDTQSSRHAPSASESKSEGGRAAGQGGFEALLDGFSKEQSGAVAYSDGEAGSLGKLLGDTLSASLSSDASTLDALLPDMPAAADSTTPGSLQAGSIVSSLIENLLPKILPSLQVGSGSETGQHGSTPFSSPSLMLPMEPSEIGIGNGVLGDRVAVSVQHQETHFKPIVEGFESIWQEGGTDTPALQEEPASEVQTVKKDPAGARGQVPGGALLQQEAPGLENHTSRERSEEEHRGATARVLDRPGERMDVQKPSAAGGLKNEPVSLPSGTLQQIASAVIEDVSKAATPHAPGLQGDALNRVAVARASAGALRVLNLQLNPVELGLVTIKMRLAGDGIEMELQAENEDTVALLRNDADKLSSLLRASGYRPDTITIQPADNSAHDRGSFQRLQQPSPDQGFQQGAAPGQGGSERRQNEHRRDGETSLPNERRDDRSPGAGRTGGVYL